MVRVMPRGCSGRLLRVDLGTGVSAVQPLSEDDQRTYVGGGLLGTHLLLTETPPGLDAFDPDVPLMFLSGVAAGVRAVGLARFSVVTKSPLSGCVAESRVEGPFGVALKESGFDGIVLVGAAETPVYLLVEDRQATLRDATDLRGLGVFATTDALQERHPDAHVAAIGPAGERRVRFASIVTDRDFAAYRGGAGAVMGAKNLKAVVLVGGAPPAVHDPATATRAAFRRLRV